MSRTPKHVNERKDLWKGEIQVRPEIEEKPLDEKEEAWVSEFVNNGGDAHLAAIKVGYPRTRGTDLIKDPRCRVAIELKRDSEIKTRMATKSLSVMESLLSDPTAPAHVKMNVAKWFLEASGHGLSAVAASIQLGLANRTEKDLSKMSVTELEKLALNGRKAWETMRSASAPVVDIKPISEGEAGSK